MTTEFAGDTSLDAIEPLPRGRHKLSAEEVRESQRQRLLRAMLESVGERGYDATSVPQVVALAKVSRNAFYELFSDKLDCFLVLCEALAHQLLEEVFRPRGFTDWREAVREGARRYLEHWQRRPLFARAYLIELPTAGTPALEQRSQAYELFSRQFELLPDGRASRSRTWRRCIRVPPASSSGRSPSSSPPRWPPTAAGRCHRWRTRSCG